MGTSWKSEVQRWHGTDRPSRVGPSAPCSPPSPGVPMLSSVLKTLIGFWWKVQKVPVPCLAVKIHGPVAHT